MSEPEVEAKQAESVSAHLPDAQVSVDDTISHELRRALADAIGRPVTTTADLTGSSVAAICLGAVPQPGTIPPGLVWFHSTNAGVDRIHLPPDTLLTRTVGRMGVRMAEFVLGWMLAETQNVALHTSHHADGRWNRTPAELLAGTTAVVFGAGHMGSCIARRLRSLDVEVVGVASRARAPEPFARVVTLDDVRAELPHVRWVVNALPLTPRTIGYFGPPLLSLLGGATFLNVGRGESVDHDALASALTSGAIRRAVLDVLPQEPPPADAPWWALPRTTLTSHSAAITQDEDVLADFLACWQSLEREEVPALAVNRSRGY